MASNLTARKTLEQEYRSRQQRPTPTPTSAPKLLPQPGLEHRANPSTKTHLWTSPRRLGAQQDKRQMPVWTAGWQKEVAFSARCLGEESRNLTKNNAGLFSTLGFPPQCPQVLGAVWLPCEKVRLLMKEKQLGGSRVQRKKAM